jgi:hypothetical protein
MLPTLPSSKEVKTIYIYIYKGGGGGGTVSSGVTAYLIKQCNKGKTQSALQITSLMNE